jgi:hypothetical protein
MKIFLKIIVVLPPPKLWPDPSVIRCRIPGEFHIAHFCQAIVSGLLKLKFLTASRTVEALKANR